jgi:hypothetical protein
MAPRRLATLAWTTASTQIVMAGNVMIFLTPAPRALSCKTWPRHLAPGGVIIAGFQLTVGYLALPDYDRLAREAGLKLVARFATWDRAPWSPRDNYAVSVPPLKSA